MPKVALADTLIDWHSLIANAGPLAEGDPQLASHLDALRARLDHARETADRRLHLEGQLRQATQDLRQVCGSSFDALIQPRHRHSRIGQTP